MKNKEFYNDYMKIFLEENSKVNLISKNDEKYLWEKHIFDSLAIGLFFEKYNIKTQYKNLLDIGTGGGFPSVPIAIEYREIQVYALDSIAKKIRAVQSIKEKLNIPNLIPVCSRVENFNQKFDIITIRAVSSLKNICTYAMPRLNKSGYLVAYKSKKVQEELDDAKLTFKEYDAEILDIIEYDLPLDEKIVRNLVIVKNK